MRWSTRWSDATAFSPSHRREPQRPRRPARRAPHRVEDRDRRDRRRDTPRLRRPDVQRHRQSGATAGAAHDTKRAGSARALADFSGRRPATPATVRYQVAAACNIPLTLPCSNRLVVSSAAYGAGSRTCPERRGAPTLRRRLGYPSALLDHVHDIPRFAVDASRALQLFPIAGIAIALVGHSLNPERAPLDHRTDRPQNRIHGTSSASVCSHRVGNA